MAVIYADDFFEHGCTATVVITCGTATARSYMGRTVVELEREISLLSKKEPRMYRPYPPPVSRAPAVMLRRAQVMWHSIARRARGALPARFAFYQGDFA